MSEQLKRVPGEQYYNQVSDSIRSVFELSTRIDERVQLMMKKQEEFERKIDTVAGVSNAITNRVAVLESKTTIHLEGQVSELDAKIQRMDGVVRTLENKVQELQGSSGRAGERTKQIIGFAVQLLWVIVAAYILFKLHLQAPAVP